MAAQPESPSSIWHHSHPFIRFEYNAASLLPETWAALGECSSKIEHISGVPLQPTTAQNLFTIFLIKGVHGTTAIEGNSLSEEQVAQRVAGKLRLPASQACLGREIDNIVAAYHHLIDQIEKGASPSIAPRDLKRLNEMVLRELEVENGVVPGRFRHHVVVVGDYRSPAAEYTTELLDRLCQWLNHARWNDVVGGKFVLPIVKAIIAHLYIAWIHPFGDGNGRTARLVEFDILTCAGVPPISAHLLSDHYNKTRIEYYRALSRARADVHAFVRYAVKGLLDGLREQLAVVRRQQMRVAWVNFVHDEFNRGRHTEAMRRRREVAIQLSLEEEPVFLDSITSLSATLAAAYAGSERMLPRDINALLEMDLIVEPEVGFFAANMQKVEAFLPLVNKAAKNSADFSRLDDIADEDKRG